MSVRSIEALQQYLRRLCDEAALPADAVLLRRFVTTNDRQALELLIARHGPMVLGTARRLVANTHDAEDVFQAVFLSLARLAKSIRQASALPAWLHKTTCRAAAKLRANRPVPAAPPPERYEQCDPAGGLVWREVCETLDEELQRLPERLRSPLLLCYLSGLTRDEAAKQLGWSLGTLKRRLEEGRHALRERLVRRGIASVGLALAVLAPESLQATVSQSLLESSLGLLFSPGAVVPATVSALVVSSSRALKGVAMKAILPLVAVIALGLGAYAGMGQTDPPQPAEGKTGFAVIRSAGSGPWSAPATWEGGKVPGTGATVQVRTGHTVLYDVKSDQLIRAVHVAGTLTFAADRDTRLDVGLIKIQPGDAASEDGFDCDAHTRPTDPSAPRPALEVGTPDRPIHTNHTALVRLTYVQGMDKESCPAIVCCGGSMHFHGAPLSHTWVKLGAPAKAGDRTVILPERVTGWRVGDRVIVSATTRQNKVKKTFRTTLREGGQTEERIVAAIDGAKLTLDKPLAFDHTAEGAYRGEVANLSRNVVVESADPAGVRGHTMYHKHSAGSISYAEFRHLGKEGVLGKYPIHYHLVGDTMRGSSVIGASVWDSGNRWVTIHGTNYLVVRHCVGYRSVGHGFFLEDGTEVYNVLDHNFAVQAFIGKPLPKQVFPFDHNDGAGFWWANSHNTFTRNVAAECDEYGYFFQAAKTKDFDPELSVQQPDGSKLKVDIRKLPFVRFEYNEAHCQRRHAFNLGGGVPFGKPNVDGVGPDEKHPFVIRNLKVWNVHWAFHPVAPSLLLDGLDVRNAEYGVWRPVYQRHAYRGLTFADVPPDTRYAFFDGLPPLRADYPKPLAPVDDLPPITVITHARPAGAGTLVVRGTTSDNGAVAKVMVNGQPARALRDNFAEWESVLEDVRPGEVKLTAHAEDAAGNIEKRSHVLLVKFNP
jgi:RNA polymerase sigma factor (sigma-70 family)